MLVNTVEKVKRYPWKPMRYATHVDLRLCLASFARILRILTRKSSDVQNLLKLL